LDEHAGLGPSGGPHAEPFGELEGEDRTLADSLEVRGVDVPTLVHLDLHADLDRLARGEGGAIRRHPSLDAIARGDEGGQEEERSHGPSSYETRGGSAGGLAIERPASSNAGSPEPLPMTPRIAFAAAAIAAASLAPQGAQPTGPPLKPDPQSPYAIERERIEREIQGVWQLETVRNPQLGAIVRASGFMVIYQGWLSINIVVTTRSALRDVDHHFAGSTKTYSLTAQNRMRLVDAFGFSNEKPYELTPDTPGTVEERTILFTGSPATGQKLRIQRGAGDYWEFYRRTPPLPLPTAPNPSDR
jgi:hypothetical protein